MSELFRNSLLVNPFLILNASYAIYVIIPKIFEAPWPSRLDGTSTLGLPGNVIFHYIFPPDPVIPPKRGGANSGQLSIHCFARER